jgi:hypothetical protein
VTGAPEPLSSGWSGYTALLAPGDFSGDGHPDLLARDTDGRLLMFRGNGAGGFAGSAQVIGTGWASFTSLFSPGDFSGDGLPDVIARNTDGKLLMYRGDGDGGWITGKAEEIGSGWGQFNAVLPGGDFSGDGHPDVLAVKPDGALLMYRGNGTGRWVTGKAEQIGTGWAPFTALLSGGDFSGDGKADILARASGGELYLYRGDGAGGFLQPIRDQIGSGWPSLALLTLAPSSPPPAPAPTPAPEPTPAPAAPVPNGNVSLTADSRCTQPGGLLRVRVKVRKRAGRAAPRVQRIVFYVRGGARRTDHHRPYSVRLRVNRPAGSKGRVYARVYYRRGGAKQLHTKTVSRRFTMCG